MGRFTICLFFLCWSIAVFGANLEKEFTFLLAPGETDRSWEINVPLPAGEAGKFIGCDFKPVSTTPGYEFQVVREGLTEENYYAKVRLFQVADGVTTNPSATLFVSLQVGDAPLADTPDRPNIHWTTTDRKNEIEVKGWSPNNIPAKAPKYLAYNLALAETGQILEEQVIPVYLVGPKIPIRWRPPADQVCILTLVATNASKKNSPPAVFRGRFTGGMANPVRPFPR